MGNEAIIAFMLGLLIGFLGWVASLAILDLTKEID
jgi:hypothetical protein